MMEYRAGDLFEADVDALVNPVNCVGVCGAGLALMFRRRFPDNYLAYKTACKYGDLRPGRVFVHERAAAPRYIINFPTKRHWRDRSRLEDIESGLVDLSRTISARRIASVAVPALGCGAGGLDWEDVRCRIDRMLSVLPARVIVFQPLLGGT